MRINWIYSANYSPPPTIDLDAIKSVGPSWGSWKSWRACGTDNVVCHDLTQSKALIQREFQASCNFYVPRSLYQDLNRPTGVKLYDGEFREEVDDLEDIISMHLSSAMSDVVLLLGFDFGKKEPQVDKLKQHRQQNRFGLTRQVIANNPTVQWVLVDHPNQIDKSYAEITNLTCDNIDNVLKLLT